MAAGKKTTTVEVVKSNRPITLTKEQLGESSLPGSEYIRATRLVREPDYSLKRLAALGLIGAGVGAGIGRGMKNRRAGRGALIGGAAGAASSLLYDFITKKDEPEVVGAVVDPQGRGSLVLVGSRAAGQRAEDGQREVVAPVVAPMLVSKGSVSDLPGWAGTVISHGMYVQGNMMGWMTQQTAASEGKHLYVQPHWAYSKPDDTNVSGSGIASTAGKEFDNAKAWTNLFAEWPSPIFKDFRFDYSWGHIGSSLADLIGRWRDDALNSGPDSGKASWEQGFYYTFGGYATNSAHSTIPVNEHWKKSTNKNDFYERHSKMMYRAQWLVWAGEMLRLHSVDPEFESGSSFDPKTGRYTTSLHSGDIGVYESAEWRRHCNVWGVGYATENRMDHRYRMTQIAHGYSHGTVHLPHLLSGSVNAAKWKCDENGDYIDNPDLWPIRVPLNHAAVKKYLEKIMEVTPKIFGTPSDKMLTIAHPDDTRMFMDFPDEIMGAMVPPPPEYFINKEWYTSLADSFWAEDKRGAVYRLVVQVVGAVVSAVASYFGGPAGTIIGAAVSICLSLIRLGLNGDFGSIGAMDICKMVGEVVAVVGAQIKSGTLKMSGDFTSFLQGIQETMEGSGAYQTFLGVMDMMESMNQSFQWPYANDVFPAVIDIEKALDYEAALGL
jgi:hypothetical protein